MSHPAMREHFIFQKTRQNCARSRCIAVFRAISGCTSKHHALRMNKTGRLSVLLFSLPFLAGCFSVTTLPVPRTQPEREALNLRGIVISDGTEEQVIQYDNVLDATWTPSSLSLVGSNGSGDDITTETRLIPITELRGLLVRRLDAGTTSAIIGGLIVGAVATVALIVTGKANEY